MRYALAQHISNVEDWIDGVLLGNSAGKSMERIRIGRAWNNDTEKWERNPFMDSKFMSGLARSGEAVVPRTLQLLEQSFGFDHGRTRTAFRSRLKECRQNVEKWESIQSIIIRSTDGQVSEYWKLQLERIESQYERWGRGPLTRGYTPNHRVQFRHRNVWTVR